MGGVRTGAINIIATATIAPLAGVDTLGDFILSPNVYGDEGVIAGAILVALLALTVELGLAGLQRAAHARAASKLQRSRAAAADCIGFARARRLRGSQSDDTQREEPTPR